VSDSRLRRRQAHAFVHLEMDWIDARKDRFGAGYPAGCSVRQDQKRVGQQRALISGNAVLWDVQAVDRGANRAGAAESDPPSTAQRTVGARPPSAITGPVTGETRNIRGPKSPQRRPQKAPNFPQKRIRSPAL
jgi:hypothetical protein